MKVWVSCWPRSHGIVCLDIEEEWIDGEDGSLDIEGAYRNRPATKRLPAGDWHRTREEAITKAVADLKKLARNMKVQIRKIEKWITAAKHGKLKEGGGQHDA